MKNGFFSSLLLIIFLFFNQINAITSAQASKMLQDAEKAKKEIVAESKTVFQMLEQDIIAMDKTQLAAWKEKLRISLRQLNKDAAVVVGTPLVVPQGTEIPKELIRAEKETMNEISKGITSEIVMIPEDVPAPLDIPEAPVIVHHAEEYDEFTNDLKNIRSFAKRPINNKNIGTFDFVAWFKEVQKTEQEIKKVPFYDVQINALQTLAQDTKNVIINSSAQWIVAYLNLQFSGTQAPFHIYFTMMQDWINDPNINHAKTMIDKGSNFYNQKDEIRNKIVDVINEVNNHLAFIINNGKNILTSENRELLSSKISEYIFGTFKNDTVAGKANIDRSLFSIVKKAMEYINHAFTAQATADEEKAVMNFDHAIIAPNMLAMFVTQKNMSAFLADFDKNNSIKNAVNSLLQERQKIEKKFGYSEE